MIEEEFDIIDDTTEESEEFRYSITSYGADYTVDSVVARIEKEKILEVNHMAQTALFSLHITQIVFLISHLNRQAADRDTQLLQTLNLFRVIGEQAHTGYSQGG